MLGQVGWLGALVAVTGLEPVLVEQRLHALTRKEFLRRERRSQVAGERQYAFRHVLVRDVAYGQLPRAARANRHRRIAEWIGGLAPDRAEDRAELLAHHWQAALQYAQAAGQDTAGLVEPARLALREAGDRALAHARRAVELLEDAEPSPVKATVLGTFAGLLVVSGQNEDALQVAGQALAMAKTLGLDEDRARALEIIGHARLNGGDRGGLVDIEQALAIAGANSFEGLTTLINLADVGIGRGDLARGFELQANARETAERLGLPVELRWLRAERALQDYWRGRWDDALDGAQQFLAEVEAGTPHVMELACRQLRGLIRLACGDLPGALADATRAVELATQFGEPDTLQGTLAFHAHALIANGQAEQASAQASELLAELAERKAMPTDPHWAGQLAIVLLALGRGAELTRLVATVPDPAPWLEAATAMAAGQFEQAAELYVRIGSRPDEAYARLRAAKQRLATGRQTEGSTQLQRAAAFYREVRASAYLQEAQALLAASA